MSTSLCISLVYFGFLSKKWLKEVHATITEQWWLINVILEKVSYDFSPKILIILWKLMKFTIMCQTRPLKLLISCILHFSHHSSLCCDNFCNHFWMYRLWILKSSRQFFQSKTIFINKWSQFLKGLYSVVVYVADCFHSTRAIWYL